ncbi:hypothetical protein BTE48_15060 [Oceanospirillum multiglobuliferum]|uniref:Uncharacterized protein n=1 Tax=Oceanospirillum multiglobuliferum TaxID=64969 RepID=A0A1V4T162_9GAMM|nr:hypothetical protein BTE48_15060 [Oceanospirillum multiglobuliferum]
MLVLCIGAELLFKVKISASKTYYKNWFISILLVDKSRVICFFRIINLTNAMGIALALKVVITITSTRGVLWMQQPFKVT